MSYCRTGVADRPRRCWKPVGAWLRNDEHAKVVHLVADQHRRSALRERVDKLAVEKASLAKRAFVTTRTSVRGFPAARAARISWSRDLHGFTPLDIARYEGLKPKVPNLVGPLPHQGGRRNEDHHKHRALVRRLVQRGRYESCLGLATARGDREYSSITGYAGKGFDCSALVREATNLPFQTGRDSEEVRSDTKEVGRKLQLRPARLSSRHASQKSSTVGTAEGVISRNTRSA